MTQEEMGYENFINEYNKQHSCCPICHSENFSSTMAAYPYYEEHPENYKDRNRVRCRDCGWVGIRHELIPVIKDE